MESNIILTDIKKSFADLMLKYRAEENTLCAKIVSKEKQLQKLDARRKHLSASYPCWTELLLRPVIAQLKLALPGCTCDDGELIPMGLGSRVAVFFCKNDQMEPLDKYAEDNSIYICFSPGDLQMGELLYETGQSKQNHRADNKPVESIEELLQFLNIQIIKNERQ